MNPPVLAPPPEANSDSFLAPELDGIESPQPRRWFGICFADVLFVFLTLTLMQQASQGMMDDPGWAGICASPI